MSRMKARRGMRVIRQMLLMAKPRVMGRRLGRRFMNIGRVMSLMAVRVRRGLRTE